jgi:GNAT superfamily N-acetyltransferase
MLLNGSIELLRTPGEHARRMGAAMARAFHQEPNFTYLLPNEHGRERALTWFFDSFVARLGLRYGEVYSTAGGDGGAVWFSPGQIPSLWGSIRAGLLTMPLHLGARGTRRSAVLAGRLERLRTQIAPSRHWYLAALGVEPTAQGRGLGAALLRPVLDRADAEALPCYLETFRERTAAFYGRVGFEVVREDAIAGGPPFWCMTRKPASDE